MKRNAHTRRADKSTEDAYREWIAPMAYCVVCGPSEINVDLAHIRPPAQGYMKPEPAHTLPLCRACHGRQETDREFFPGGWRLAQERAALLYQAWHILGDGAQWARNLGDIHEFYADRKARV